MSYWHIPNSVFEQYQESSDSDSDSESTIESEERENTEIIHMNPIEDIETPYESADDSDDSDMESDMMDYMYYYDLEFLRQEKEDAKYYLGNIALRNNTWLLEMSISPKLFYRYSYNLVKEYMMEYSYNYPYTDEVRIIKLNIVRIGNWPTYCAIDKTYWIRLIQRHWRAVCKKNRHKMEQKKSPIMQRYREIHGKYPIGLNRPIGLCGLLAKYGRDLGKSQ